MNPAFQFGIRGYTKLVIDRFSTGGEQTCHQPSGGIPESYMTALLPLLFVGTALIAITASIASIASAAPSIRELREVLHLEPEKRMLRLRLLAPRDRSHRRRRYRRQGGAQGGTKSSIFDSGLHPRIAA